MVAALVLCSLMLEWELVAGSDVMLFDVRMGVDCWIRFYVA